MASNFDIHEFAKEVVYDLRSVNGDKRYVYDDGCAHLSEEQFATVKAMMNDNTWDQQAFDAALKEANNRFATDVVEGNIDIDTLPSDERRIARRLEEIKSTGNEDLIDSAKDFVRASLSDEIKEIVQRGDGQTPVQSVAIHTKASWASGLLNNVSIALDTAMQGQFEYDKEGNSSQTTLGYFIKDRGVYDQQGKDLKLAAKALKADMRDHLEANAPELEQKTGLSAVAQQAATPTDYS